MVKIMDKFNCIKTKNLSYSKDTIKREWTVFRDSTSKHLWDLEINWIRRVIQSYEPKMLSIPAWVTGSTEKGNKVGESNLWQKRLVPLLTG